MDKEKNAKINVKNEDDRCFQYSTTIALNYYEMRKNHQRLSKIKRFAKRHDWDGINFPSHVADWKRFELNNKSVA